ncbi:MAG: glutathione S-transferase family protein [Candidatus Binataceae bacterium]
MPRDPANRARARAFEDYSDAYVATSLYKILIQLRKPEAERDRAKIAEGEGEALKHFAYLDKELAGREFFARALSLADISFVPHLSNYERAGYKIPDEFRNLKAWWERMKARPSYAASMPPD